MNPRLLALSCVAVLAATVVHAQSPALSDKQFVEMASVGNTFEVMEAKLALEKASDKRVKDFAQKMIDDHGDAEKKLEAAAGKAGAKAEMMLDKPHQAMLDNLKTFTGQDFDKIYIADQAAAHADTVNLLSDYKQNGKNSDLKSWTSTALPIVKMHQMTINAM